MSAYAAILAGSLLQQFSISTKPCWQHWEYQYEILIFLKNYRALKTTDIWNVRSQLIQ